MAAATGCMHCSTLNLTACASGTYETYHHCTLANLKHAVLQRSCFHMCMLYKICNMKHACADKHNLLRGISLFRQFVSGCTCMPHALANIAFSVDCSPHQ